MARVTVEDCLKNVENRFELVLLASQRVRQLKNGSSPLVDCDNKEVVCALREIAGKHVRAVGKPVQVADDMSLKVDIPDLLA